MTAVRSSLRAEAVRLAPTSLKGDGGDRMLYTIHLTSDGVLDWFLNGFVARFPTFCPDDGLARLCRDRRIVRGPAEPPFAIKERLRQYRWTHKVAGNAYSVLRAVGGFLAPHYVRLRIWTNTGMVYTRDPDGTLSYQRVPGAWDWDGDSASTWRWWLVIYPPATLWTTGPTLGDAALWGGALGSPGYVLGFTATPAELAGLRTVIAQTKSLNSVCDGIIVAFDPATFAPGAPEPNDGGWFRWSVPGTPYTPKRLATARYCAGVE